MAPENKPNTTTSRFKSRFSILSLLPSRHPPLIVAHPPLPPTRSVESRHPTIVSSSTISPVHSEYPSPSTPFPLTPLKKTGPHRPPPLDLDRTRMMYPPSFIDVVIDPGTAKPDPTARSKTQEDAPPLPKKGKEKKTKTTKVLSDPFEIAEVEVGHRYPSWQGGKVDIKPGQVIPPNMIPTRSDRRQSQSEADNYESVLHNVLLTPTYLGPSPTLIPTPSPSSSPSYSPGGGESSRRRTLVDRAANTIYNAARRSRHSHWIPKGILKNTEAARSLQALREREEQEMDRFRRAATSRLTVPSTSQGSRSFSSGASPIREMHGTHRRSPGWMGNREWDIGYEGKRARVVSGEMGWRERRRKEDKANRRQKIWKYSIAIIILCLAALTIGLCTSLLTKSDKSSSSSTSSDSASSSASASATTTATSTSASASASSTSTSQTLTTCLSLFTSSAPTSPTSYPCSDCVPLLESTTNDFSQNIVNGNSTGVGSALQFCALMDIHKSGGVPSGWAKDASPCGWAKDASPCGGWTGISCDSRGRITGVSLTYPDVPNVLPSTLGNIYALESLHLQGNSSVPTGSFPGDLLSLPNFTTLDLQYTALTGPISSTSTSFTDAKGLITLNLVSNKELGTSLPDLSQNSNLLTLSATGQNLTSVNEEHLPPSLTYLDLSYNSLSGAVPSFPGQTALVTLYLEDNKFTTPPTSLPSTLQTLSLTSNTELEGNMPSSVCSSTILSSCDLRSTGLKASNSTSTSTAAVLRIRATINSTDTSTSAITTSSLSSASTSTSSLSSSTISSAASASASTSTSSSASASCGVCQFS